MTGLVVILVAAGLVATSFGQFVSAHQKLLAELGGIVIVIFGLNLLGVIQIGLFERQFGFQSRPRRGFLGAFLMGLVFAAGWTPCIGPIAGSILLLAANAHSVTTGGLLLLVYALGLSLPFLAMALVLDRVIPILHGLGRHLPLVSRAAGLLLVLLGAALITGWYSRIPGLL
jgi:cytochrome c-type biogenesis protein